MIGRKTQFRLFLLAVGCLFASISFGKYIEIGNNEEIGKVEVGKRGVNLDISGVVTDQEGEVLIGVNILLKGTDNGTSTDFDGKYELSNVPEDGVLIASYVGYQSQEIEVNGRAVVDIQMSSDAQMLEELVVVGYGSVKKSDLTGSVATIDGSTFQDQPMTQVSEMLTGTVAGFYANQGNSASGGGSLEVRGPNSLNASSTPMIVLDGVIYNGNMSDINPTDIESIDILKDASSAAVYGARAASGVIIISTKKGGEGKPVIRFNSQLGLTNPTGKFEHFQGEEYLQYRADVLRFINPGLPDFYYNDPQNLPDGVSIEEWRNASGNPNADNTDEWLARLNFFQIEADNYKAGNVVNWYDEVIQTGFRQNYDLSISGGTKDLNYYWSIGYQDNEGVIRGDKFTTIRSRLNLDYTVNNWLNVGLNTQFSNRDQGSVTASLGSMYNMSPYGSIFEENGDVKWFPNTFVVQNPLINYYGQDRLNRINTMFSSLYANITLPFGINYNVSYQPRFEFAKDYNFWSSKTIAGGSDRSGGYATREEGSSYSWIVDNILSWNKEIGIHNFDVTLLYSAERNQFWNSYLNNQSFVPNQNLGFGGLEFGTNPALRTTDSETTGDAAMARLNYTLMNKYLFTASIRRDGYSAFGNRYPRATFPAAAFAWKISDESFFNSNVIDNMKLRFSWGVNGNRDIGPYSSLAQLSSTLYFDGSNVKVGVFNNTLANRNLRWEKTRSFNVGVDMGFVSGRINVNADLYKMNTTDLLLNRLVPEISGYQSVTANLGELSNIGFELTVNSFNIDNENFQWNSNFVFSLNRNKIVELFGDVGTYTLEGEEITGEIPDYSNEWFPGHAIDHIWNYDILGIWQLDEADEASRYRLVPGDFKATDVNDDGKYEALQDKQFIGYSRPRFRLGLRNQFTFFKNWQANIFIRGDLGHMGSFSQGLRSGGIDTYDRRNTYKTPYWSPSNPINDFPSLTNNASVYGGGLGFYKPLSFVRIQDLSISYSFPEELTNVLKSQNIRMSAAVRNLYSFDKWPGWDPESLDEPMPRTFTIGLNITLQ
ncbi:SusC/RagA family TonB-linked outer membrane protein [Membranihabitans maritimus]|uniref:SusC/RagA family TonB-linked outer membrane protein n=1 Tax=Membranihabitans maritimus TaxID=2904244 RepID=UPI001F02BF00|nr:SusC/RagA family TonB-linked outer membrane protein [Membranihabitans maritimus]